MNTEIRAATETDSAPIAELLGQLGYPTDPHEVKARLASSDAGHDEHVLAAESNGKVVAFASLAFIPMFHTGRRRCRISAIAVDPALHRRGVGRRLMEVIDNIARERGCAGIEVTSAFDRTDAHRFYLGLGYEKTSVKFRKAL